MKTTMIISKIYATEEQYYASPEYKEVYRGYENNCARHQSVEKRSKFIAGYVVSVDPATNYGRDFLLLRHYRVHDGVTLLKEQTIHSCLDNGLLHVVKFENDERSGLPYKIMINYSEGYEKNTLSRRMIAKAGITVC